MIVFYLKLDWAMSGIANNNSAHSPYVKVKYISSYKGLDLKSLLYSIWAKRSVILAM